MRSTFRTTIAVAAVTLMLTSHAFAIPQGVPEIDPSMGVGAFTLLCGVVMVIRGRRKA
jgi:hypothetical protein